MVQKESLYLNYTDHQVYSLDTVLSMQMVLNYIRQELYLFKGSWIEFATDINDIVMYAYIDRKKKTYQLQLYLRAIGYETVIKIFLEDI